MTEQLANRPTDQPTDRLTDGHSNHREVNTSKMVCYCPENVNKTVQAKKQLKKS